MKTISIFLVTFFVSIFILTIISSVYAESSYVSNVSNLNFTIDMQRGDESADVSLLQDFLAEKGFLKTLSRGYFGPLTTAALSQYQRSKSIAPAIGYFGPKTRKAVNADSAVLPNTKDQAVNYNSHANQNNSNDLTGFCYPNKFGVEIGESDTWEVSAFGGTGTYTYKWTGDDSLNGKSGARQNISYRTSGTKNGSVKVTSGNQNITVSCGSVYVNQKDQQDSQSQTTYIPTENYDDSTTPTITDSEVAPYLTAVGEVVCVAPTGIMSGSGSLWNRKFGHVVLTNQHVTNIVNRSYCVMVVPNSNIDNTNAYIGGRLVGYKITGSEWWSLDDKVNYSEDKVSDKAILKIGKDSVGGDSPNGLNYKLEELPFCPNILPKSSPVTAVGFPAKQQLLDDYLHVSRIVTFGKFYSYIEPKGNNFPGKDYVVTAEISHGNSGGLAFSKTDGKLCILGIPTYIFEGSDGNQYSVIENINNVFHNFP